MNLYYKIFFLLSIIIIPTVVVSQIRVLESERSDTTRYSNSVLQDSVYIVYKQENGASDITLIADLNGIDSLNYEWSWYDNNEQTDTFKIFSVKDSVLSDTIHSSSLRPELSGGYRVHIFNSKKGIDTTFTIWLWYQNFFINGITVYKSTCTVLELEADTNFSSVFKYYDLSTEEKDSILIENSTTLKWITDPDSIKKVGVHPRFTAPVEPTTYFLSAVDNYGFERKAQKRIDEKPDLRAVKAEFRAIHGIETDDNKPSKDTAVRVEAPHGVWFYNDSKNGEEYEWIFYNHIDWRRDRWDTVLFQTDFFEPIDSIYYERPPRNELSPKGYDVKLTVWGPEYNDYGDRCMDTMRKVNFVLVDTTHFPNDYKELPNVFTPNAPTNNYFYFVDKPGDENKPVTSIKYFSIKIYNRWGNKVYEYEDNDGSWHEDGKENPGWDGTTRVGTKAKPGVYYYTILSTGWDEKEYKVGGYVHIF